MSEPARQFKLSLLAPAFLIRIVEGLRIARREGLAVDVFETFRTEERQAWLYAQGRTRPGGIITKAKSAKSSWHGHGLGTDLAFRSEQGWYWPRLPVGDGTEDPQNPWVRVRSIMRDCGIGIGPIWDWPHFQPTACPISPTASDRKLAVIDVWKKYDQLISNYYDTRHWW